MEHFRKCPILHQECTTEDLMEYNETAKEWLGSTPVDGQYVVTRQEEEEDYTEIQFGDAGQTNKKQPT